MHNFQTIIFIFALFLVIVYGYCPNDCSLNGICVYAENIAGICSCNEQWNSPDCSLRTCPKGKAWSDHALIDGTVHNEAECSNRGTCDRVTGACNCDEGFEGIACERMSCPNNCNDRGNCSSIAERSESVGFSYVQWDADKIFGCICDEGFEGYDCSLVSCPQGVVTTTGVVSEIQAIECFCDQCSGSFDLKILGIAVRFDPNDSSSLVQERILFHTSISDITVNFVNGATLCSDGPTETQITFISNLGSVPAIEVLSSTLISATAQPIDLHVFAKGESTSTSFTTVTGVADLAVCSGRGTCDNSVGECTCLTNFGPSDGSLNNIIGVVPNCGYQSASISTCPEGTNDLNVLEECSGKGVCSAEYYCTCSEGYSGLACEKYSCPKGVAWFDDAVGVDDAHNLATCSNRGYCNLGTGECICFSPFTGLACEKLVCPGGGICSNKGTCYSLANLVLLSETFYGELLGLSYNGWDKDSIYGCYCDRNFYMGPFAKSRSNYIGHDCSLNSCPYGHNTDVLNRQNELQLLTCETTNSFYLAFAGKQTLEILPTDTIAILNTKLAQLTVINGLVTAKFVNVVPIDTGICASEPIELSFNLPGDVPLFAVSPSGLNITIIEKRKGTTEPSECSNQGTCNRETGECECFDGQLSSDGSFETNGYGEAGDCGTLNEFGFIL